MTGHVFAFRGDLSRLACDALLLPCDQDLNISRAWQPLLPPGLTAGDWDWLRLPEEWQAGPVVVLPDTDNGRQVRAVATTTGRDTVTGLVDRLLEGIGAVVTGLPANKHRHLPLIGLPLVGTGEGGLGGRRGEVIDELIPRLRAVTSDFDIALVLRDQRDLAAVQERRPADAWPELGEELTYHAERLGKLAATGQLSLFLGAGVSRPVGLPDWWELLKRLATKAGMSLPEGADDPIAAAGPIVDRLGDEFHTEMRNQLSSDRHGIGHGLLAGLRARQMVTTNFDPCMELALEPVLGRGNFRVLTRNLADSGHPWLLKLHGDIERDGSLVLTRSHYDNHAREYAALHGVVQSLMLTSSLLFVGFSMKDENFLKMAHAVKRVRADAGHESYSPGTALALTGKDVDISSFGDDLTVVPMLRDENPAEAARLLEIFLDRLAWEADRTSSGSASYLLDDRYSTALRADDRLLRDALDELDRTLPADARRSAGWPRVQQMLRDLGREGDRETIALDPLSEDRPGPGR